MEIKIPRKLEYWIDEDLLGVGGHTFQFIECKTLITKKGLPCDVFVMLGSDEQRCGDFLVPLWKIENLAELVEKYGKEDKAFKDKIFIVKKAGKKVRFE